MLTYFLWSHSDAKPQEPVWKRDFKAKLIGSDGGEIDSGQAKIAFDRNALKRTHNVKLEYQLPAEHSQPEDVLFKVAGEEVQLGPRITVSMEPESSSEPEATDTLQYKRHLGPQESTAATSHSAVEVNIQVNQPRTKPNPDVYTTSTTAAQETNAFRRVTESVGLKLVKTAKGAAQLIFNAATCIAKAGSTVFEVVWSPSQSASDKISSGVEERLTKDENEPLHVRLHYQCNRRGYPYRLLIVIASGLPPSPEADGECEDGLYAARCTRGKANLKNKLISTRDHVSIRIKPLSQTQTWKMESGKYTYKKTPESKACYYNYHGMGLVPSNSPQPIVEEEWEVLLEVEKNGMPIGNGNTVMVVRRRVSS